MHVRNTSMSEIYACPKYMHIVAVVLLNGYTACSPTNKNLIGFKSKKTLEVLSLKNTLRYLGKPIVVP